jgi:PAS domain S-box-containing protein
MMPESRSIALALAHRFVEYEDRIEDIASQLRQYKNVIDLCPLPMFFADEKGNCVYANQAMQRLLDDSLENIQHDGWQDHVHPDDLGETIHVWSSFVKDPSCRVYEHQHRYIWHDGTSIEVLVKAQQMPCNSIVGFAVPTNFMNFTAWLRGADLENLPPMVHA